MTRDDIDLITLCVFFFCYIFYVVLDNSIGDIFAFFSLFALGFLADPKKIIKEEDTKNDP